VNIAALHSYIVAHHLVSKTLFRLIVASHLHLRIIVASHRDRETFVSFFVAGAHQMPLRTLLDLIFVVDIHFTRSRYFSRTVCFLHSFVCMYVQTSPSSCRRRCRCLLLSRFRYFVLRRCRCFYPCPFYWFVLWR